MTNILLYVSSQLLWWKSGWPKEVPYLSTKYTDVGPTAISKTSSEVMNIGNSPMFFLGELTVILTAAVSIITESSAA